MELNEVTYEDARPVDGYGPGFFRVAGEVIQGPMIATGKRAVGWAGVEDIAALTALAGEVDVILYGTGETMAYVPAEIKQAMEEIGIGIEPMTSPTACRTYNVLLSEGRRVALAVLPV